MVGVPRLGDAPIPPCSNRQRRSPGCGPAVTFCPAGPAGNRRVPVRSPAPARAHRPPRGDDIPGQHGARTGRGRPPGPHPHARAHRRRHRRALGGRRPAPRVVWPAPARSRTAHPRPAGATLPPGEVEAALIEHPAVAEAAVAELAHTPSWGRASRPGSSSAGPRPPTSRGLRQAVRERDAAFDTPGNA